MATSLELLAAVMFLSGGSLAQAADPKKDAADLARSRVLWSRLSSERKAEVVGSFEAQVIHLDTFQNSLMRYIRGLDDRDLGSYPLATEGACFDPKIHAPAQPIARRWVEPDSRPGKQARARFLDAVPERRLDPAYSYDYARREVVRHADDRDPERIFENGLAGMPPGLDVVEALVEGMLDDGSEQLAAQAFGHAYTDRSGQAFRGLTLYDAWASGARMEMPDVDQLGIVHTCLNEWKRWKAPVSDQEDLYEKVGELFQELHRHRGLRHALARCYAAGDPVLRDGYAGHLDRFHALWDQASSRPSELAPKLPEPDKWEDFLLRLARDVGGKADRSGAKALAGESRRWALEQDSRRVRDLLRACLAEETTQKVAGKVRPAGD